MVAPNGYADVEDPLDYSQIWQVIQTSYNAVPLLFQAGDTNLVASGIHVNQHGIIWLKGQLFLKQALRPYQLINALDRSINHFRHEVEHLPGSMSCVIVMFDDPDTSHVYSNHLYKNKAFDRNRLYIGRHSEGTYVSDSNSLLSFIGAENVEPLSDNQYMAFNHGGESDIQHW